MPKVSLLYLKCYFLRCVVHDRYYTYVCCNTLPFGFITVFRKAFCPVIDCKFICHIYTVLGRNNVSII